MERETVDDALARKASELGRAMALLKWASIPKAERKAHSQRMHEARWGKRKRAKRRKKAA